MKVTFRAPMRRCGDTEGRLILMAPIYGETSVRLRKRERRGAPRPSRERFSVRIPDSSPRPLLRSIVRSDD